MGIRPRRIRHILAAMCLASAAALQLGGVHARGSSPTDHCSVPLPPQLAFTGGGPGTAIYTLHGTVGTLRLMLFGRQGLAGELRLLGFRALAGETVGEFELVTLGGRHVYAGPVHIFHRGASRRACRAGAIMIDAHGNTTQQRNVYVLSLRIDGVIRGRTAVATVRIGKTIGTFTGTRSR